MRSITRGLSIIALCIAGLGLAAPTTVHAQTTEEGLRDLMERDLTTLSVNLPVWMSQHLPAVMAPVGIGAGSGIDDNSGAFKLGVLTRLGLFNNFDDVGQGLSMIDVQSSMPSLVPWPQFGVVLGGNLGNGIEIGGDFQFIPAMDIAADNMNLKASLFAAGVTLRWRVNKADGALPAFIVGLGGAYYRGSFEVGAGTEEPYSETVNGQTVTGKVKIQTAPGVDWSIFQVSPEVRLAWDFGGIFRPYVGVGLGLSFGTVGDHVGLRAQATVETVNGQAQSRDPVVYQDSVVSFETQPATWTLRPHVGFDVIIGVVAITVQLDLAVMGKSEIDTDLSGAADSFDLTDPDLLFNENARSSQTNSALIGTVAARLQF